MDIKVLTTEYCNCSSFASHVQQVVDTAGIDASVETIEDIQEIMSYGVMSSPALVIDGEVKVAGRVPSPEEIADLLPPA